VPDTDLRSADGRAARGVPPLPLAAAEVTDLIGGLAAADDEHAAALVDRLAHRVAPGVGDAARVKAAYLAAVARAEEQPVGLSPTRAVELLGTMGGGYNVPVLVDLLTHPDRAADAAAALADTVLVFDAFHDVVALARAAHPAAEAVLRSWAAADWLTHRRPVPDSIHLTVFRVDGETNTDDLSPAPEVLRLAGRIAGATDRIRDALAGRTGR